MADRGSDLLAEGLGEDVSDQDGEKDGCRDDRNRQVDSGACSARRFPRGLIETLVLALDELAYGVVQLYARGFHTLVESPCRGDDIGAGPSKLDDLRDCGVVLELGAPDGIELRFPVLCVDRVRELIECVEEVLSPCVALFQELVVPGEQIASYRGCGGFAIRSKFLRSDQELGVDLNDVILRCHHVLQRVHGDHPDGDRQQDDDGKSAAQLASEGPISIHG